jgi:hypothetical protein
MWDESRDDDKLGGQIGFRDETCGHRGDEVELEIREERLGTQQLLVHLYRETPRMQRSGVSARPE